MNLLAHAALLIAAVAPHPAKHHHRLGPVRVEPNASAYCPGSSGTTMADGHSVYFGAIASAYLPMHTLIRTTRPIRGRTLWRVRDRGGAQMRMDFWLPSCGEAIRFGRRAVSYRVVSR
jgi:3D (Asp-Asp-Asp) domain-containing protein